MKTFLYLFVAGAFLVGCQNDRPTAPTSSSSPLMKTTTRSITEFVNAQGTHCWDDGSGGCFLFVDPIENFIGWSDPSNGRNASVDYAGLADRWLKSVSGGTETFGTTFSGHVTEQTLDDGRALISVELHTKHALMWVIQGNIFQTDPVLFGWRPMDVYYNDKPAAFGNSTLKIDFTLPHPGDPLPDLMKLLGAPDPGMEVKNVHLVAEADGVLRSDFGVPDGTPGRLQITQVGAFQSKSKSGKWDGFPSEHVKLMEAGK